MTKREGGRKEHQRTIPEAVSRLTTRNRAASGLLVFGVYETAELPRNGQAHLAMMLSLLQGTLTKERDPIRFECKPASARLGQQPPKRAHSTSMASYRVHKCAGSLVVSTN